MAVTGNWVLHFSWGPTDSYAQAPITFNSDGTFSGSYTGQWRQQSGTIQLTFDGGPAKYGGTVNNDIGSGIMSTFSGLDGAWYLSKEGTSGILSVDTLDKGAEPVAGADGAPTVAVTTGSSTHDLVGAGSGEHTTGGTK